MASEMERAQLVGRCWCEQDLLGWWFLEGKAGAGYAGTVVEKVAVCCLRWAGGDGGVWGGGGGELGCGEGEEGGDGEEVREEIYLFCPVPSAVVLVLVSFFAQRNRQEIIVLRGKRDLLTPLPLSELQKAPSTWPAGLFSPDRRCVLAATTDVDGVAASNGRRSVPCLDLGRQ